MNYIELFKKSVKKNKNKIALVHDKRKISYEKLDILSSKVAHKLHKMGAKSGDFIAINMPRSIEYAASYLGILKAGLIVVPLSTKYPRQRVDFILNESNAFLEIKSEFFDDIDDFEFYENLGADDADTLLIYTSGSTGRPKGIIYTNKDLSNVFYKVSLVYKEIENMSFASITEFSYALFFVDFLVNLCLGCKIHIINDEIKISAQLLQKYFKNNDIYAALIPPSLLQLFKKAPKLKVIYTASERLNLVHFKNIILRNFYGMSESNAFSTTFKVDKKYKNTPIGKPLKDLEILILDKNGKKCKKGKIGEIIIKGEFNQRYFNDPEKSAKTFVKKGSKTLVYSGDLGYKDKNNNVILTGRKDWMVKIHGQRVEIYEIEANLKSIKNVKECAIKAFGKNDKYLVAFIVGDNINVEFLQNELAKKLPNYMIPRYFVFMDVLPKNTNGKIDRNSLKEPNSNNFTKDFKEPKSTDEIELCKIFASVLGCDKIGLNDDFSLLGGDSLIAGEIASISKLKGINPSLILREKTPENIIKACKALKHLDKNKKSVELSPTQNRMYFDYEPKSSNYYLPFYIKLPRNVDLNRLKYAIESTFLSHKIFCAKIKKKNSKLYLFYKKEKVKLEFKKIQSLENFTKEFLKPFNLLKDKLYIFSLCKCKKDLYLFFTFHHIIFDGVSLNIFLNDIADFYTDKKRKIKPESYAFSHIYSKLLESRKDDIFEHKIKNIDSGPTADLSSKNIKTNDFILGTKLENSKEILSFLKANKITPDSFFMSIFALCLFEINKQNECEIYSTITSRYHKDLEHSINSFIEIFPIHFEKSNLSKLCLQKELYTAHSTFLSTLKTDNISASFVYENDLFDDFIFDGKKTKINIINIPFQNVKIHIMVIFKDNHFTLILRYNYNFYSKKFAQNFCDYYLKIINEFLGNKREI